jgi:hypothetical protein
MSTTCAVTVTASLRPDIFMLGTRDVAEPLRSKVEGELAAGSFPICIDFAGVSVTQSFMDEFLGVMILRHGPLLLERIVFQNCGDDVQAIVNFVASVRLHDFELESRSTD